MAKYKKLDDYNDKQKDDDKPEDPMRAMRDRYAKSIAWDQDLRVKAIEDYKFTFVPGNQWDPYLSKKRGKRPTYEFNTTRQLVKQVTNDQRQNRPAVKFSAKTPTVNDRQRQSQDLNELMNGMFRNDWNVSSADTAVDTAFQWGVTGGFGVWGCNFRFENEANATPDALKPSDFYKEIYWEEKRNPFSVKFDPDAKEYTKKDGMFAFEDDVISRNEFKTRFPDAEICSFQDATGWGEPTMADWWMDDTVRIARYWYKEQEKAEVVLMSDGKVYDVEQLTLIMDELAALGVTEVGRRETTRDCVYVTLVSGSEELEKPTKWPGKYIPLIPVWGELSFIDGKPYYSGMVRYLRDPQALKNFHKSVKAELIAKAPKAPYMASPEQIKGFEEMYKNVGEADYSVLMYNRVGADGGPPMRSPPPDVPSSLIQAGLEDNEDMKSIAGLYDPSLGAGNGQRSGKAVLAEQRQGNTANFDFIDNLTRSLKYAGEIYADLAPRIYDTTRSRRILGKDGKESFVQLNQPVLDEQTGETIYLNDLSQADFDVAVTVGPSYSTQRIEANEMLTNMAQNPQLAPIVADLIAKTMDFPLADELEKRLRAMGIKQGFIEPDPEDPKEQAGPSPQEQQMMAAIQQGQAQMQEMGAALADMEKKLMQAQLQLTAAKSDKEADMIKTQIDAYNAETNRLKVQLEAQEANQKLMLDAAERAPTIQANQDWAAVTGAMAAQAQASAAPKIKQGTMVRNPDGSYSMTVIEGQA